MLCDVLGTTSIMMCMLSTQAPFAHVLTRAVQYSFVCSIALDEPG